MPSPLAPSRPARHFGIIGGLGALASHDLYSKLAGAIAARGDTTDGQGRYRLTLDRQPYRDRAAGGAVLRRKLYLYDRIHRFEAGHADGVLLPCFISHTFLGQLQAELGVRVFDMMAALAAHVGDAPLRIGVLCSTYVREQRLFERYFPHAQLVYPQAAIQRDCVMRALYGDAGADGDVLAQADGETCSRLRAACADLERQGAQLIIPGASEFAALAQPLQAAGHAVVDSHQVYAMHVLAQEDVHCPSPFKLGIVGGIGPAATVDFMQKIIRNTPAGRDQDHVRLIVDHNPQIPDRTANLVGNGDDPTLALYSACRRLEENGAALIAMPCNTAHAYIARMQDRLATPIVNMLDETVRHIVRHYAGHATVGLLATSGTVSSGVYHAAAEGSGFDLIVPDARHQQDVMEAIYGEHGVKAGYTDGPGKAALLRAAAHLAGRGATVLILGCTELPLLLPQHPAFAIAGKTVALLDPTDLLALRCVALAHQYFPGEQGDRK
jgi:aspartate racemase